MTSRNRRRTDRVAGRAQGREERLMATIGELLIDAKVEDLLNTFAKLIGQVITNYAPGDEPTRAWTVGEVYNAICHHAGLRRKNDSTEGLSDPPADPHIPAILAILKDMQLAHQSATLCATLLVVLDQAGVCESEVRGVANSVLERWQQLHQMRAASRDPLN
jgi:hypothetical protein